MIQVFVTGGTFDKQYNYLKGTLYFKETHIPSMLEKGRASLDIDVKTLMMVDSLEMNEADRMVIGHNCTQCAAHQIVITHGTDGMVKTAAYLASLPDFNKTIVLTGAMIPYAFGTSSDGFFNLGSALAFVQILPAGIYIVMNGRFFEWDKVEKNLKTGFFDEK